MSEKHLGARDPLRDRYVSIVISIALQREHDRCVLNRNWPLKLAFSCFCAAVLGDGGWAGLDVWLDQWQLHHS